MDNHAPARDPVPRPRLTAALVALAVFVIILAIELPPSTVLGKADVVGYGICHRITERSFIIAGRQLPLCARCTGTFLGALVGLGAFIVLRRHRASRLPPVSVLGMLIVFVALWGVDGLNSYLTFFPGGLNVYEPQNWLRLSTGLLNGIALVTLVWPIFNFTLWREPAEQRALSSVWELLAMLPVAAVVALLVQARIEALLYPLAILSAAGVLVMLALINTMIANVILGREGYARTSLQALVPLTVGTALAILQLSAMVLLRGYLTVKFGLPF